MEQKRTLARAAFEAVRVKTVGLLSSVRFRTDTAVLLL
jgi:hypothetical protein